MPRTPAFKPNDLLKKLMPLFRERGFAAASIGDLAAAAGLSKASLYHHFPKGKPEMARRILALDGMRMQALVLAPLSDVEAPKAAISQSLKGLLEFYEGERPACMMNSLLLGEGGVLFREDVARAVAVWLTALEKAYFALSGDKAKAQSWSYHVLERVQGALILCRVTGGRAPLERTVSELQDTLEAGW